MLKHPRTGTTCLTFLATGPHALQDPHHGPLRLACPVELGVGGSEDGVARYLEQLRLRHAVLKLFFVELAEGVAPAAEAPFAVRYLCHLEGIFPIAQLRHGPRYLLVGEGVELDAPFP